MPPAPERRAGDQSALAELQGLLQTGPVPGRWRLNTYLGPITYLPVEANGRRFCRAQGVAESIAARSRSSP